MLKLGPIKPSSSPLDSLVVLVKRKMGMSVSVPIFASGSIVSNSLSRKWPGECGTRQIHLHSGLSKRLLAGTLWIKDHMLGTIYLSVDVGSDAYLIITLIHHGKILHVEQ